MTPSLDVVALGEPLYEFSELPDGGRLWQQGYGGDTMNCAIAAARQGARAGYVTRLGDDDFGRRFLALWRDEGLDVSGVGIDPDAHTAVYFITHGPAGHAFSYLRAGSAASRMRPEHLPLDLIRGSRFFYSSGISQAISTTACDTVAAAIRVAKDAGVQVVYGANIRLRLWPASRAREVITTAIPQADVFLLSVDDAEVLCGGGAPDTIVDWCHGHGATRVVLTLGRQGLVASDGPHRERLAGHDVEAVDATGAGDCLAGALMARLAAGDDYWTALRYANAAAALTTLGYGAVSPLPRPADVRRILGGGTDPLRL